jgi:hypothetical protein
MPSAPADSRTKLWLRA